jgi:hypothetical protein
MMDQAQEKAVVTVAEMARMVGLSRARFYQLQRVGVFPLPAYDIDTRRPVYTSEQQKVCLEVRRRNCGINGRPVLFYARKFTPVPAAAPPRRAAKRAAVRREDRHIEIVDALRGLGLTSATAADVDVALRNLFPGGTAAVAQTEVIRAIFVQMRRQDSGDRVGR